jgi:M6 family metalloprotease-like protein
VVGAGVPTVPFAVIALIAPIAFIASVTTPGTSSASLADDGAMPDAPGELDYYPEPPGREPAVSQPRADLYRWPSEAVDATTDVLRSSEPLLVILFKFKDTDSSYPAFAQTAASDWQAFAFGNSKSIKDYYDEASYGGLTLTAASESHGTSNDGVTGWYTASNNWSYYTYTDSNNNTKADRPLIIKHALAAANAHVDFSSFDDNNDNVLSATELHILVVAAAREESFSGVSHPKVWRSNWCLYSSYAPTHDGVRIACCDDDGAAAIVGELDRWGQQLAFGLAAHEIGHQLGWPDFYDTDPSCSNGYVKNQGIGRWGIMASGDWLGDYSGNGDTLLGYSPAHPCAWSKAYRGWTIPVEVTEDADSVGILDAADHAVSYKLWTNGAYGASNKQYFMVENRQRNGYDGVLPGTGLIIYHVDEAVAALDYDSDNTNNWDDNDLQWDYQREFIDVECADGYGRNNNGSQCTLGCENCAKDDLDVRAYVYSGNVGADCSLFTVNYDNRGDAGNPYPGSTSNTDFNSTSCPGSEDNSGNNTSVAVENIETHTDTLFADLVVGNTAPYVPDVWLKDCAADTGAEPSGCNPFWVSPDIWVDNDRDGTMDAPVQNARNRFWVGVRNSGNAPATNVTVKLYYRSNSTGLSFPTGATLFGTSFIGLVPASGAVRTEMVGTIPNPPQQGHWCFGATLDCLGDALNVNAGLTAHNNKACVNIGVLAGRAGQAVQDEFLAETPDDSSSPGGGAYAINLNGDLPGGWVVFLEWRSMPGGPWEPYTPGQPFMLAGTPEDDREFRLTVQPPAEPYQGQVGTVWVEQIYLGTGDNVGGIHFPILQDNHPPLAIDDLVAEAALGEPGQWGGEIAVRLSWTPPTLDVMGNPETVRYYEVHRSTTAGFSPAPETLIASPAADQDTLTAGWQFTDPDTVLAAGETYYYNVLAIDMAAWASAPSNEASVTPVPILDHADHDVGNCILTMTDQGILGFMDETQTEGSGFIFPATGDNLLYLGSLWVGESETYIANRDYGPDPTQEWVVSTEPDGHVTVDLNGHSDQDIYAGFTDEDAATPRGLHVRQESWAFADPPDDELIIVRYMIENRGSEALTDLRVGLFLDVDIPTFTANTGGTDAARRLAYVRGGGDDLHVGARLLVGDPQPEPVANVTLIYNPTYIHPQGHMLDVDKWGFLTAGDPQYVITEATEPNDYSLLVSVGPLTLAAGAVNEVPVAIVGGVGLAELLDNADRAQALYAPTAALPGEAGRAGWLVTRLLPNVPNPFNPTTSIRFDLERQASVDLAVYDVSGRLVRRLIAAERQPAGRHVIAWDGRDASGRRMASGVYFLRLETGTLTDTRRVVLLE